MSDEAAIAEKPTPTPEIQSELTEEERRQARERLKAEGFFYSDTEPAELQKKERRRLEEELRQRMKKRD